MEGKFGQALEHSQLKKQTRETRKRRNPKPEKTLKFGSLSTTDILSAMKLLIDTRSGPIM
jgi:hypothetical protein